ncbi:MAG: translation elongation factor Ts, partial [Armatimonadetes bacterium]|nr:translation elongation factor Ts [Armatimonadota bacterium]
MAITAQDVKKLRDETGAPFGDCKAALEEAGGDHEKALIVLREKGAAAAAKRSDRATSEGIAMLVASEDGKSAGGVVIECETDFVAKNEDFKNMVTEIATVFRDTDPGSDPSAVKMGAGTVGDVIQDAVNRIRENIRITRAVRYTSDIGVGAYVHHDRKSAAAVIMTGTGDRAAELGKNVAIQVVAMKPVFLKKDDIPADVIAAELEVQVQRAINEGKPEAMAKNIAQGRINKEFYMEKVLLEQPFYLEPKMTTGAWLAQEGGKD